MPSFTGYKMKYWINKSVLSRLTVLVLTLATFMGAVSTYMVGAEQVNRMEVTDDDSGKQDNTSAEIAMVTFQAIINFIHIDLHFESYLIQELTPVSEIIHFRDFDEPVDNSEYFNILFRFIISPNAP